MALNGYIHSDQQFLAWLHDRLEVVHGEHPLSDYMHRFRAIILSLPPDHHAESVACNSAKRLHELINERQAEFISQETYGGI